MAEAKIFGVVALKGGVGKTTVATNLGATLASEYNKRVLIIDANFSTPHLGIHVGLIDPEFHLHGAMNNDHSIYEAIYQHPLGFHVIPGKLAPTSVEYAKLKELITPLREIYDIIIIDSSPALNEEMASAMEASDEIIVVSSPDYPTLSSTIHAVDIAQQRGTPIRGIVLNKVRGKRFELNNKDVTKAVDMKVLASIPDNIKVLAALAKMIPIVNFSPSNEVSNHYKKLAGNLIGEEYRRNIFGFKKKKNNENNRKE